MKTVAFLLRRAPGAGDRLVEGLRNAVGLAAERGADVAVYLVQDAARLFAGGADQRPAEARLALDALRALRRRVVVEAEALAAVAGPARAAGPAGPAGPDPNVETAPRARIFDEISRAEALIVW